MFILQVNLGQIQQLAQNEYYRYQIEQKNNRVMRDFVNGLQNGRFNSTNGRTYIAYIREAQERMETLRGLGFNQPIALASYEEFLQNRPAQAHTNADTFVPTPSTSSGTPK